MAFGNTNIAIAINQGGGQTGGVSKGCRHHHHKEGVEKPDRNPFLDFLTAPLQALGKMDGNQNDKEYSKYAHAHEAGNALKGFV
ncbi:hypothetical protein ABS71_15435 [bacterium SCN 62-11]|nr:hypothetical protein [Candidatus Eremiobacteraeota bacterium]ODT62651.1 MAG: hypothetical protein ABS71_15435 [bacterium SCN 62-11]